MQLCELMPLNCHSCTHTSWDAWQHPYHSLLESTLYKRSWCNHTVSKPGLCNTQTSTNTIAVCFCPVQSNRTCLAWAVTETLQGWGEKNEFFFFLWFLFNSFSNADFIFIKCLFQSFHFYRLALNRDVVRWFIGLFDWDNAYYQHNCQYAKVSKKVNFHLESLCKYR